MGKKYTTDEIHVGGHNLDASMMVTLNSLADAGLHSNAGYLTTYTDTNTQLTSAQIAGMGYLSTATGLEVFRSEKNIDDQGTYMFAQDDGGWTGGNRLAGAHNGYGVISMHLHSGSYYGQIHLSSQTGDMGVRFQENSATWGTIYTVHTSKHFSTADVADGKTAHGWGNHSGLYLPINNPTLTGVLTLPQHLKATGTNLSFSAGGNQILNIDLNGKIYPSTDASSDLGFTATSNRFRHGNFSGTVTSGTVTATSSSRAPIFYDSNNTGYYVNPASTSNLNGLTVQSTITGTTSGNVKKFSRLNANADTVNETSVTIWDVSGATDDPPGAADGLLTTNYWDSSSWATQNFHDFHNNKLYIRSKQSGTWQTSWDTVATQAWVTSNANSSNANLLDGLNSTQFIRSDVDDTFTGKLAVGSSSNRDAGIYGIYDSNKIGQIWSMGVGYHIDSSGATFNNLYGLAYKHTNNPTGGTLGGGHQMMWTTNGVPRGGIGENYTWHDTTIKAPTGLFDNVQIAASIQHSGDTNTWFGFDMGSDIFRVVTNGTERYRVDNDGTGFYGAIGLKNTSSTSKHGIDLYGGAKPNGQPEYGMMFTGTSASGTSGDVTGDWATYFTMNGGANRGWIFKGAQGNTSSISSGGVATFNSAIKSPVFYDSNNTGYYVDPAGTSLLNELEVDGDIDMRAQAGTWITSDVMSDAIGWNSNYGVYIGSNVGGTHYLRGNGTFTTGGGTYNLWHAGNDGSGSGLDADLLDGIDSSGFVKQLSDASSPDYTTPSSRRVNPNTSNPTNEHYAVTTFGNNGNVTGQLATHFVTGLPYTRGFNSVWSPWRKIWTDANDGSGSGLDADLLDGQHASAFQPAGSYLTTTGKAADSNLLDGVDSTQFMRSDITDTFFSGQTSALAVENQGTFTRLAFNQLRFYEWDSGGDNLILNNGYVSSDSSFRAPIFYDSDNTGYYLNPASTSKLNAVRTESLGVNTGSSQTNKNGLSLYGATSGGEPTYGMMFTGTAGSGTHGAVTSDWATYFTMNNANNRGWIFRRVGSGNSASISAAGAATFDSYVRSDKFYDTHNTNSWLDIRDTSGNYHLKAVEGGMYFDAPIFYFRDYSDGNQRFTIDAGIGTATSSLRAPIFYDSNNTGYYVNPASTSSLNSLNVSTINRNPVVQLSGDVTGSATMTNLGSININAVVNDDSHKHSFIQAGSTGPSTEDLNAVADSVSTGQLSYRGYNSSSTNKPPTSDNANGVITVGQHSGTYNAQLAFSSDGNMYWRDNPSTSYGSWRTLWDSGNLTNVSQLTNDSNYLTTSGKAADSNLLDGIDSASFLRSNDHDSFSGTLTGSAQRMMEPNDYGKGVYGKYSSTRFQHVWGMGSSWHMSTNGTSLGNFYGIAYTHSNVGTGSQSGFSHQTLFVEDGVPRTWIGQGVRTVGDLISDTSIKAPNFYDLDNTGYYVNPAGTSRLGYAHFDGYSDTSGNARTTTGVSLGRYTSEYAHIDIASSHGSGGWIDFSDASGGDYGGRIRYHNSSEYMSFYAGGTNEEFRINSSYTTSLGSSRAPVFYDNDNTNYFLNPASTSRLNLLTDYRGNYATHHIQSGSDFANGTLVTTNINANVTNGDSYIIEVTGKSYSSNSEPFSWIGQGYLYNNTIISHSAISQTGIAPDYMKVFKHSDDKLAFWWPRYSYWNSFEVRVRRASGNSAAYNAVTSIVNSAEPSSDKKVQTNIAKVWTRNSLQNLSQLTNDSGYLTSLPSHTHPYLPLTGGSLTGPLNVAGNVGIGTTSPGVKLDVSDIIRGRNSIRVDGAITGSPYFGLYQGGEEKAYIQYVDAGDNLTVQSDGIITLKTGSTERVRVTTGGNVGIGTTSPTDKLHVDGSIKWEGVGTSGILSGSEVDVSIRSQNDVPLVLGTNSATVLFLDPNDYVYKLGDYEGDNNGSYLEIDDDGQLATLYNSDLDIRGGIYAESNIYSDGDLQTSGRVQIDNVKEYRESFTANGNTTLTFDVDIKSIGASGQPFEVFAGWTHYSTGYGCMFKAAYFQRSTIQSNITLVQTLINQSSLNGGFWSVSYVDANTIRITKNAGSHSGGGHGYIRVTHL